VDSTMVALSENTTACPAAPDAIYFNLCEQAPDFDIDDNFRLADAVYAAEVWSQKKEWPGSQFPAVYFGPPKKDGFPCGDPPGDFDKDSAFRLADAVFTAEVWSKNKDFPEYSPDPLDEGRRRLVGSRNTYGSLVGFKEEGQTMQIHAFLGTDPVITVGSNDLKWKTVEVAFSGGTVESAVAHHDGLTAMVQGTTTVGIGDLSGSGNTFPSGLAMTVTFSSDTNMDNVMIDFTSPATAITTADAEHYPTVAFEGLGNVASVVQGTGLPTMPRASHRLLPSGPVRINATGSDGERHVAPLAGVVAAAALLIAGLVLAARRLTVMTKPRGLMTAALSDDHRSPKSQLRGHGSPAGV